MTLLCPVLPLMKERERRDKGCINSFAVSDNKEKMVVDGRDDT